MPPRNSGKAPLTVAQIETLKLWIKQGAKYERLWSISPLKPGLPPKVSKPSWVTNPIDAYVLHELDSRKMLPAPKADKATLLRRATLAITGLQPSPQEITNFLKDSDPRAYEKAVDRLLSSQRYGENQARYWLDAVRYGDTHGLHLDNERAIYPYRDWVVKQYNQDLPFSTFLVWQLAGDMLPNPTQDMLTATGYIRMNPTTAEGGAIEEEFLAKNTFDRVDTTSTVLMGLTVACARCHDHKYDPVSQDDYYKLYAFFNSTTEKPFDDNDLVPGPTILAPSPEQALAETRLTALTQGLVAHADAAKAKSWLSSLQISDLIAKDFFKSKAFSAKSFDEAYDTVYQPEANHQIAGATPFEYKVGEPYVFIGQDNAAGYVSFTLDAPKAGTYDVSVGSDDAVKVWINSKLIHANKTLRGVNDSQDNLKLSLEKGSNSVLVKIVNGGGADGFKLAFGNPILRTADELRKTIDKPETTPKILDFYLMNGPTDALAIRYRQVKSELDKVRASIPRTLIAKEMDKPRKTFVLKRGEYNLPDKEVSREIPAMFGALPANLPKNRLGLATWLSSPSNALVHRVFVNRIWQQHFGTGLVKTAEDFGNQGEWPSHPELLDYLASRLAHHGSLKQLHKEILMSSAFQQASVVTADKLKQDPENRLISRGPRYRLDAEVIRDQALYSSGLLKEQRGGKGFRPYQPPGLWEAISFPSSNTSKYVQDTDDSIYRRSLYLFWKRTSPHPIALTFDAPMRESCVVRRAKTNTPLQALLTMNETAFVESARAFGVRLIKSRSGDAGRINMAFWLTVGRIATEKERAILMESLAKYRESFKQNPADVDKLLTIGLLPPDANIDKVDQAAWAMIANTVLNLDEFLTQH
jgi:hypothetical protein